MRLRTFGGLGLEGAHFTRPKPLLMLAYLALEGPQERRFLAGLFWTGAKNHMKSLTVALTRLRQGAPGVIEADHERVWATVETDAGRFLALLERGEPDRALELYQGPFLHGFYLRNVGAELEEWIYGTREFLASGARRALLELAEREAAGARFLQGAKRAEAALRVEGAAGPEPEELSRLYGLLRAASSPHAAEVQAEASSFGLELACSPEEARERLRQAAAPPPHNLPVRGTSFVGRDLELAELASCLAQPHCRLLSLVGPAGAGKTRLALQVAREALASGSFGGGAFVVSLAALSAPELIPAAIAEALGLESNNAFKQLTRYLESRQDEEVLLVLDSFEHLLARQPEENDGAHLAAAFVGACANLTLLVTSRERLNVEEERIFPVAGLPFPGEEVQREGAQLNKTRHYDAVRLFVRRAKRARPDFELTAANLPAVLRICRLVEGLPLGLELAAASLRVMPSRDIANELEGNLDILATSARNVPERHKSMRSAFEHSWNLLSAKEREALRRLAVFRGGFSREAASEVAGATIPILAALVDKSLLRVSPTGRFYRHPLLYQYSREKLVAHREGAEAGARHAAYFLRLAGTLRPRLLRPGGEDETGALKTLTEEHDNLRAALAWSLEHDRDLALRLVSALRTFWEIRGYLGEACRWLGAALEDSPTDVPAEVGFAAHAAYGRFLFLRGDHGRAEASFAAARKLARATGQPRDIAEASNHLGLLALEQGDNQRAEALCEEALALHRAQDNKRGAAVTLTNLGNVARARGDDAKATELYEESLALLRELGIRRSEAVALGNLGFALMRLGRRAQAAERLAESVAIRHELADEIGLAHSLLGVAGLLCDSQQDAGDCERAATLLGAVHRVLEATSVTLALADRKAYEASARAIRDRLGEEASSRLRAQGRALSRSEAVRVGLELAGAAAKAGG